MAQGPRDSPTCSPSQGPLLGDLLGHLQGQGPPFPASTSPWSGDPFLAHLKPTSANTSGFLPGLPLGPRPRWPPSHLKGGLHFTFLSPQWPVSALGLALSCGPGGLGS